MANLVVQELSDGARALFDNLLPKAALFHLPIDAQFPWGQDSKEIYEACDKWKEHGIMPYAVTATEFRWSDRESTSGNFFSYVETVVFYIQDELLMFVNRMEVKSADSNLHMFMYAIGCENHIGSFSPKDIGIDLGGTIDTTNPEVYKQFELGSYFSIVNPSKLYKSQKYEGMKESVQGMMLSAVHRINWLVDALQSIERSAFKRDPLTRQVARATGYPRESWEIIIRRKNSRDNRPTCKSIFHTIVKEAWSVRGHMRTNYRTGRKNIKVKPFIKGKGKMVQIKDYVVK